MSDGVFYKGEISALSVQCPPADYSPVDLECFRWVYDTKQHPDNFKAQAIKNPPVINDKSDEEICAYYALSFHTTSQASRDLFDFLVKRYCGKKKEIGFVRFGQNIAKGTLLSSDGVQGELDDSGHFNFHHIKDHNFVSNFAIVEPL